MASLARTRSASSSARLCCAGGMRPAVMRHLVAVAHHRLAGAGMALDGEARDEPGRANAEGFQQRQDALRPDEPELPRESGVGLVMPRAMKPDWVSKSKVRQTMWRGTLLSPNMDTGATGIA